MLCRHKSNRRVVVYVQKILKRKHTVVFLLRYARRPSVQSVYIVRLGATETARYVIIYYIKSYKNRINIISDRLYSPPPTPPLQEEHTRSYMRSRRGSFWLFFFLNVDTG